MTHYPFRYIVYMNLYTHIILWCFKRHTLPILFFVIKFISIMLMQNVCQDNKMFFHYLLEIKNKTLSYRHGVWCNRTLLFKKQYIQSWITQGKKKKVATFEYFYGKSCEKTQIYDPFVCIRILLYYKDKYMCRCTYCTVTIWCFVHHKHRLLF